MSDSAGVQDSSLEVNPREIGPQRIAMDHRLMIAVKSGNKNQLLKLLPPEAAAPNSTEGNTALHILGNDVSLLGVTAEGNTALHIAASYGYLDLAEEICRREKSLLMVANTKLDTPLHCAVRAGDHQMVDLIIRLAMEVGEDGVKKVLRAKNRDGETILHGATQYEHLEVTKKLMVHDPELASIVNDDGISPLYFAVMSGSLEVVQAIIKSCSKEMAAQISAAGPNKQTALHAAVLQSPEITEELLKWNRTLAKAADASGSTPLHYAAGLGNRPTMKVLLEYDKSAAYLPDKRGLMPVHRAALTDKLITDNIDIIEELIKHCPDSEELLDADGNNFLHQAIKGNNRSVVRSVCRNDKFEKLMNDKNYEGKTPLHLAAIGGDQEIVRLLVEHKRVRTSMMDKLGFTPLDYSAKNLERGARFRMHSRDWIFRCLAGVGAAPSPAICRAKQDSISKVDPENGKKTEKDPNTAGASYSPPRPDNIIPDSNLKADPKREKETKKDFNTTGAACSAPRLDLIIRDGILKADPEKEKEKETKKELGVAQNVGILSVLIAGVTFAAAFTMPGGYEADDRPNPGASILARRYAFKIFIISDTVSFICSITATLWFIYAGSDAVDRPIRFRYSRWSLRLMNMAAISMITAFALGVYVVLSPISKRISILVCVMAFTALGWDKLYKNPDLRLVCTLARRLGWSAVQIRQKQTALGHRVWVEDVVKVFIIELAYVLGFYCFVLLLALL